MISVGIIGCGRAGQLHFEAINHSDDAQVLAIADSDKKVLRQREKEWGVEMTLERYTELLHLPWLDAVIIALPNHLHKDVTIQAVREHLHVLCEKPIATTTREADAMIDAAEKHDVLLMVAESMRYEKETIEITKLLREGAIGRPVFAELNWLHKFERYHYADRNWLNDPARSGGGQWIINGTHLVSALRGWFHAGGAGDVEQIFAKEYRSPSFKTPKGIEASVNAFMTFSQGQSAKLSMALEVDHHGVFNGVRIHGTEGSLVATGKKRQITIYSDDNEGSETLSVDSKKSSHERQLDVFLNAIERQKTPITSGFNERNTLAVIEAGYQSMRRGNAIPVDLRS